MPNKFAFSHEERPNYQRENIDLALKIVLWLISDLWVDNKDYDPNLIRYVDSMWSFWWINTWFNRTEIDFRFWFNTKVHIHEILHAYSHNDRTWRDFWTVRVTWYHTQYINNCQSHNHGLNEWITQHLTLSLIQDNSEEIAALRSKYKQLMKHHQFLWETSWDPNFDRFSFGCENTGWFRSYFREMRLVNAIIDLVSYQRSKSGEDIDEHKEDIWDDLIIWYFLWDFSLLRSILKEADSTWLLKKHLEEIKPWDVLWKIITDSIREHIKEIFNPSYRMSPIPTKISL